MEMKGPGLLVLTVLCGALGGVSLAVLVATPPAPVSGMHLILGRVIPLAFVNLTITFQNSCACRVACFTQTLCHEATAEIVSNSKVLCHLSYSGVAAANLTTQPNAVSFFKRGNYMMIGARFYRLSLKSMTYSFAVRDCHLDGGFLAVFDTPDKMKEVTTLLNLYEVSLIWTGGTVGFTTQTAQWCLPDGTTHAMTFPPILVALKASFCIHLERTENGSWTMSNIFVMCSSEQHFVCQKN
ncbi:uncharacterized protein [Procambarus clarkii]|uniref:uncharacterized protein n=1 Tax=Procambarus clarkii TaxID=6728 RepID=UPI001E672F98|nr:uncharacterized protein LOC123773304 [Procambarus clarkii]